MILILKKFLLSLLLPPGALCLFFLILSFFTKKTLKIFFAFLSILAYLFSIEPTQDLFLKPLEYKYPIPSLSDLKKRDVYVVLGSGVRELKDITILDNQSIVRVTFGIGLYLLQNRPIILSGGRLKEKDSFASTAKRFLLSFPVKEKDLILEEKSRDTLENAKFVYLVCKKEGFKRPLVITHAYHMRRSMLIFKRYFDDILAYPVGFFTEQKDYDFFSFLPDPSRPYHISLAFKEYLGILFYSLKYFR